MEHVGSYPFETRQNTSFVFLSTDLKICHFVIPPLSLFYKLFVQNNSAVVQFTQFTQLTSWIYTSEES